MGKGVTLKVAGGIVLFAQPKETSMKNPITSAHATGFVVGAGAAWLGLWLGLGMVLPSTAGKNAAEAATAAKVAALAPICADRFSKQPDAAAKVAALTSESSWGRAGVVEKSGFATAPGAKSADSDVARACAELIVAVKPK